MAIAATPITHSRNIYDLLRQIVPPQEKVVDLYRRLLAINELSGSMNAARDVDSVIHFLAAYFLEHYPEDPVRFCILDGARYRSMNLSGPIASSGETRISLNDGIAGSVMKSKTPIWIPDAHSTWKIGKSSGTTSGYSGAIDSGASFYGNEESCWLFGNDFGSAKPVRRNRVSPRATCGRAYLLCHGEHTDAKGISLGQRPFKRITTCV